MLTPEQIEEMDKVTGWGNIPNVPVSDDVATPSPIAKKSRADEIRELIKKNTPVDLGDKVSEIATDARAEYQKTKTEAELRQEAGQQGAISTGFQVGAAAAKAGMTTLFAPLTASIGAGIDSVTALVRKGREIQKANDNAAIAAGTLKPEDALSRKPDFEDTLMATAEDVYDAAVASRAAQKQRNPGQKDILDIYQESSPTTKANLGAVVDVGEAALNVVGGKVAKDVTKKVGEKVFDKALGVYVKAPNVKQNIINKAVDSVEAKYQSLSGNTIKGKRDLLKGQKTAEMKNAAGTVGKPPERLLAEQGVLPRSEGGRLVTNDQADELLAELAPLQETNKEAIRSISTKVPQINLLEQKTEALKMARSPKNVDSGTSAGLVKEIEDSYNELIGTYGETISVDKLDDIKSARWGNVKFDSTRPLKKDADYIIGKTAQKTVEDVAEKAGYSEVAQMNREVGDRLGAIKYLRDLDNRPVKGAGFTRLAATVAGALSGTSIPQRITFALGGDFIAKILIDQSVAGPVKRLIMANLSKKDPAAYKVALEWLQKQGAMKDVQLALPPRSEVGKVISNRGTMKVADPNFVGDSTGVEPLVQATKPK